MCRNKGRLCWKIAKFFYFCHLKKLVRPETFGPYYVHSRVQKFPVWHTKAGPNGKCCWGIYSAIYGEVNVSVEKCVEINFWTLLRTYSLSLDWVSTHNPATLLLVPTLYEGDGAQNRSGSLGKDTNFLHLMGILRRPTPITIFILIVIFRFSTLIWNNVDRFGKFISWHFVTKYAQQLFLYLLFVEVRHVVCHLERRW